MLHIMLGYHVIVIYTLSEMVPKMYMLKFGNIFMEGC